MRRTPSLHINIKSLIQVLEKLLDRDNSLKYDSEILADRIMIAAKPLSITNRGVSISNQFQARRVNKILKSGLQETFLFNKLLSMTRKQRRHVGVKEIKEGDRNWGLIKEATACAADFCNDFDLKPSEGFKLYINTGLDRMNKFSLNRFPMMHEQICLDYQSSLIVDNDSNKDTTLRLHKYYCEVVFTKTGLMDTYEKNPSKYICFVRAAEICINRGVNPNDYVDAQFEGLSWTSNPPEPSQLIGENAWHRFSKYAYSNSIKLVTKKDKQVSSKLEQFIKDHGQEIYSSD
tara:strand:+ start:3580 stop:4449 length:870 start_codon:yes stop_codon:yes gene_type:complete